MTFMCGGTRWKRNVRSSSKREGGQGREGEREGERERGREGGGREEGGKEGEEGRKEDGVLK